jgi:hypothetical protein
MAANRRLDLRCPARGDLRWAASVSVLVGTIAVSAGAARAQEEPTGATGWAPAPPAAPKPPPQAAKPATPPPPPRAVPQPEPKAPAAAPNPAKPAAPPHPKRVPAPPPGDPLDVDVALTTSTSARWLVRITNREPYPVRVSRDPSHLVFDLYVEGQKKPTTCTVSTDLREGRADELFLDLPPGRSLTHSIDPRLVCFGEKARAALASAGKVVVRYGVASPKHLELRPPFVVSATTKTNDHGNRKQLVSDEVDYGALSAPTADAKPTRADGLLVRSPRWVDVRTIGGTDLSLQLKNMSADRVTLFARPKGIGTSVSGPSGDVNCLPQGQSGAIRELYTTLGAKGSTTLRAAIERICPRNTFAEPGVYRLRPFLDVRATDASGIRARFDVFESENVTEIRVRMGKHPALKLPEIDPN